MTSPAPLRKLTRAFSLVEVTMAIGIVAFALTAIMGLLSITLKNSKSAQDDTLVAEMTGDLIGYLRKQPFNDIPNLTNIYFDLNGKRINPVNSSGVIQGMTPGAALTAGAVYECQPVVVGDPRTVSASGATNLWRLTLNFQWPPGASKSPNRKSIHADIARY